MYRRIAIVAPLLALACAQEPTNISVKLLTKSCATGKSPLDKVGKLKFTITGEGIAAPLSREAAVGEGSASIPAIPPGKARRILVEAISETSAATMSLGQSAPFDLTGEEAEPVEVAVFLRQVDQFTPTNDVNDPGKCTGLVHPRSGHTATLLNDGRVLIVGGYVDTESAPGSGLWVRDYLASAEIYDPKTGGFAEVAGPLKTARAYHTATKLKDSGNVLVVGGETKINDAPGPLQSAELFDVKANAFGRPFLLEGGARTRHTATQDSQGRILFAGGANSLNSGAPEPVVANPAQTTAWFDPTAPAATPFKLGPSLVTPRHGHAAVTLSTNHMVVIGGRDQGDTLLDTLEFFIHRDGQFYSVPDAGLASIRIARRAELSAVRLNEDGANRVIVAGGIGDFDLPTKTAQFIDVVAAKAEDIQGELTARRAQHCMVALPDDGVLVIGGKSAETGVPVESQSTADVIYRDPGTGALSLREVQPGPMRDSRHQHTCTVLQDGSVLVLGGVRQTADGRREVLGSAEIYVPQLPAR